MVRINCPFKDTPGHGHGRGSFCYGPHPHPRAILEGVSGLQAQGPCGQCGVYMCPRRGPDFSHVTCTQHCPQGAPHYEGGPPRGPCACGPPHQFIQQHQHCLLPLWKESLDTMIVDNKLASVDHELNQNEEACGQLKVQRAMLLSKRQELQEEKKRAEEQREEKERQYLESNANWFGAFNDQQAIPTEAVAAKSSERKESTRLIQGIDGRFYRVLVDDVKVPADGEKPNKAETKKISEQNVLNQELRKQEMQRIEDQLAKEYLHSLDTNVPCIAIPEQQVVKAAPCPTAQIVQSNQFMSLLQGPDGRFYQVTVVPTTRGSAASEKKATALYSEKNEKKQVSTVEKQENKQRTEEQEPAKEPKKECFEENTGRGTSRNQQKANDLPPRAAPQSQFMSLVQGPDGRLYRTVVDPAVNKPVVETQQSGGVHSKETERHSAQLPSHGNDNLSPVLQAAFADALRKLGRKKDPQDGEGKQVQTDNKKEIKEIKDTRQTTFNEGILKSEETKIVRDSAITSNREGVQGFGKSNKSKNTIHVEDAEVGVQVECKKQENEESTTESVEPNAKEDVEKDEAADELVPYDKMNIAKEANADMQVEDVPKEEWEEIDTAASIAGSSLLSSLTPKTFAGESWMEPVEGDIDEESGLDATTERSSQSPELVSERDPK